MSREVITIAVETTGVLKATKGMNALGAAGGKAATSADMVKKALKGIGALLILKQLRRMADSYRNISNRIATVTKSHAEAAEVMARVFKIANDTRQSFEATGIVYARVANAATDLGKSHEEVLSLVRGLNQAMAIGGTTSREANAALIQFSQGLASGTLRGDELRSVLEQSVVVSEVLSRGLGVTRGELKKMGEAGKISSELIFQSFAKMKDELETRFGELIPTLSQSFEIFKNHLIKFVGEVNEGIGVTRVLGHALVFLGKNLEYVAGVIGLLLTRFAIGIFLTKMAKLIAIMKVFGTAWMALYGNIIKFAIADALLTLGNAAAILGRSLLAVPLALFGSQLAALGKTLAFARVLGGGFFVTLGLLAKVSLAGLMGQITRMALFMGTAAGGATGLLGALRILSATLIAVPLKLFNLSLIRSVFSFKAARAGALGLALGFRVLTIAMLANPFMLLVKALAMLIKLLLIAISFMAVFFQKSKLGAETANEFGTAISKSAKAVAKYSDKVRASAGENLFFAKSGDDIKDSALQMAAGLGKTAGDVQAYADSTKSVSDRVAKVNKSLKESGKSGTLLGKTMARTGKRTKATSKSAAAFAKKMDLSHKKALRLAKSINRSTASTEVLTKKSAKLAAIVKETATEAAKFGKEVADSGGRAMTLGDVMSATWDEVKIGVAKAAEYITKVFKSMGIDIDLSFKGVAKFAAKMIDSIYQIFYYGADAFVEAWSGLPAGLADAMTQALNAMVTQLEKGINRLLSGLFKLQGLMTKYGMGVPGISEGQIKAVQKLHEAVGGFVKIGAISNPWEGAAKAHGTALTDAMIKAFQQTPVQDLVDRIWDAAAAKAKAWKAPVNLKVEGPDRTKPPVDTAAEKFIKSFRSLEGALMPVLTATRKQTEAHNLLNRALKEELITDAQYVTMQHRLDASLEASLNPFGAMLKAAREEHKLLLMSEPARARYLAEKAIIIDLTKKHENVTQEMIDKALGLYDMTRAQKDLNEKLRLQKGRELAILKAIKGPQEAYNEGVQDLIRIHRGGALNAEQYAKALAGVRIAFLDTQTDFDSGMERALLKMKLQANDTASVVEEMLTSTASSIEDNLISSINGFNEGWTKGLDNAKEAFKSFVDDVLQQLTRLMLRQTLLALFGLGAGGGDSPFNPGLTKGFEKNFASGGSFRVGGTGGPDSQQVAFMASPGERVTIQTPAQQSAPQVAPVVNLRVVNQVDPNEAIDAMNSPAGERVILNTIRKHARSVKRVVA